MSYQVIDKLGVFNGVAAATISDTTESFRATESFAGTIFFRMTAPTYRWTGADIGDGSRNFAVDIILRYIDAVSLRSIVFDDAGGSCCGESVQVKVKARAGCHEGKVSR